MKSKLNNTKNKILQAGIVVANEVGYTCATIEEIADEAGVVAGTIHHHFNCAENFKDSLVKYAIDTNQLKVIAQAIATGHRYTRCLPPNLREQAINSLF